MALTTDLVSYWKLDEDAANTTVADAHGSNTGTASTNTANLYIAGGKIDSAFDFDGSSQYITVESINGLASTTALTFSLWINPNSFLSADAGKGTVLVTNGWRDMIQLRGDDGNAGKIATYFGQYNYYSTAISTGEWTHVVATVDGTALKIYINNVSESFTLSTSLDFYSDPYITSIGCQVMNGPFRYVDAKIDEVGIWSRALTSDEVTELYNSGDGLAYPFTAGTNMKINIGDSFKDIDSMKINIADSWKDVAAVKQNIGNDWKGVF